MHILQIVFVLFGIGALFILRLTKNELPQTKNKYWIKYAVYFFVVMGTLFCLSCADTIPFLTIAFAVLLAVRSIYELYCMQKQLVVTKQYLIAVQLMIILLAIASIISCKNVNIILIAYTFVFVFDGFAQIGGQLLKGLKLAPAISPGKTWSGVLFGFAIATLLSIYLMQQYAIFISASSKTVLIICCFAGSIGGDLFASIIKRQAGAKDYVQLLPQHGGLMDRYDSFFGCFALLNVVSIYQFIFS
jgi:phosphatidate cytidylyltransferase